MSQGGTPEAGAGPDALVAHCRAAKAVEWEALSAAVAALPFRSASVAEVSDVHRAYVEDVDRPRCDVRADHMLAAIDDVEAAVSRGDTLDWAHLVRVQGHVLGGPVRVREGPAFAKRGRERYGHHPQLATALEGKLTTELARGDHPLVAATRAYLDLCFFHPFEDGNARAARLAMHFVLAQGKVGVKDFGPVFRFEVPAGDREAYRAFLAVVSGVAWGP